MSQLNGIVLIDKQPGISSYDVIRSFKRELFNHYGLAGRDRRRLKIGHSGTLDPFATGLLIVLLGRATKLTERLHRLSKVYEVTAHFGYETTTQDIDGEVIESVDNLVQIEESVLKAAAEKLTGKISQMPPQFSAKKVDGRPAYRSAHKGIKVELKPRDVCIKSWELVDYNWPKVRFRVDVSTGTYVRTLVVDLARSVGSLATAVELRRLSIGRFALDDSLSSDQISTDSLLGKFIAIDLVEKDLA